MAELSEMMNKLYKLQSDLKETTQELAKETVTTGAGMGAIKITMNGQFKVLDVQIDPSKAPLNDANELANLIKTAFSDAIDKVMQISQKKMKALTDQLKMPGL